MGYEKMDGSEFVRDEDALHYAMEKCGIPTLHNFAPEHKEFQDMLVEWYFSGNWVRVDD